MATNWQGGTGGSENDPTVAGNWSNGLPSASSPANFTSGTVDVDGGATGATWKGINFGPGYSGRFGLSSSYVDVLIGSDGISYRGQQDAYVDFAANVTAIPVVVRAAGGLTGLYLKGPTTRGEFATQILTVSGQPANTNTVVVDTITYTFQTTLTDVTGNVLIGASALESIQNLMNAINGGPGAGLAYAASMLTHTTVRAYIISATKLVVESLVVGTAANAYSTTETHANGAWANTTMDDGVVETGITARVDRGLLVMVLGRIALARIEHVLGIGTDARLEVSGGTAEEIIKAGGSLLMDVATSWIRKLHNIYGAVDITAGHLAEIINEADGSVDWQTNDGALTARIHGGVFTAANDILTKTIDHIEMHGEAQVDLDNGISGSIVLTEGGVYAYGRNIPKILNGAIYSAA